MKPTYEELEAQCAVMREVLEFYANPANYVQPSQMAGQIEHSRIEIDFGQKAREALSTD